MRCKGVAVDSDGKPGFHAFMEQHPIYGPGRSNVLIDFGTKDLVKAIRLVGSDQRLSIGHPAVENLVKSLGFKSSRNEDAFPGHGNAGASAALELEGDAALCYKQDVLLIEVGDKKRFNHDYSLSATAALILVSIS